MILMYQAMIRIQFHFKPGGSNMAHSHGFKWNDEAAIREIKSVMSALYINRMPSNSEIKMVAGSGLGNYISRTGGFVLGRNRISNRSLDRMVVIMAWGNCETCVRLNTDWCDNCEYNDDPVLEDNYVEASREVIAERLAKRIKEKEEKAINETIVLQAEDRFKEAFLAAKKCTDADHFKEFFASVHASADDYLVSSDCRIMFRQLCDFIPKELKGRNIVRIDGDIVGLHNGKYPNYKEIFDSCSNYVAVPLEDLIVSEEAEWSRYDLAAISLKHGEFKTFIQPKYFELMKSLLAGNIRASYSPIDNLKPLLFSGDNGDMVIVPVKTNI